MTQLGAASTQVSSRELPVPGSAEYGTCIFDTYCFKVDRHAANNGHGRCDKYWRPTLLQFVPDACIGKTQPFHKVMNHPISDFEQP